MKTLLEQYDTYETEADKESYYDACVVLMDDDLEEALANSVWGDYYRIFLAAYAVAHKEKYGEDFVCQ
jgi:hypothetical protein